MTHGHRNTHAGTSYRRAFLAVGLLLGLVLQFTGVGPVRAAEDINNLSIADSSLSEPDSGTNNMIFTVTLTPPAAGAVTVHYATSNGSALAPADYTATNGDLTFATGEMSKTIAVPIVGENVAEGNETFTVTLSGATNASISDATATGTIINEDGPPPFLSVNDATVTEGNSGTTAALFTVSLAPPSTGTVTVHYATVDGTATAPADYQSVSGDFTFTPGQTSKTVSVPVVGDLNDEPDETFTLQLSNPNNADISDDRGTGTIIDDDTAPTLSINDVTVGEGADSGTTNAIFTVTLSSASGNTVVVDFATSPGTATAGIDYTHTAGSLTFAPGQTQRTISVPIIGDAFDEPNETFTVTLTNPFNATIADGTGVGTITDNDATPGLTINDVTVQEGNTGTTPATFTVTLSAPSNQTVTVHYATGGGSATAGTDYTSTSGDLIFSPGQTSKTVAVPVVGDTSDEANETFNVVLSSATNATVTDGTGVGTITDDDGVGSLSVNDATPVAEGNSGTTTATFTVTLSPASGQTVTVNYATASGTATAGTDFEPASGQLTFTPGQTTKTVVVTVYGDTLDEANETFALNLSSPTNATISDGSGTGTINDDDATGSALSVNDVSVTEGNSGTTNATFTVTLSPASTQTVTVNYTTANGTATAGTTVPPSSGDYTTTSGSLTFTPGQTSKTVAVPVVGDTAPEPNETFTLELSAPTNAIITDGSGTGTILNDDGAPPSISIADTSVTETNAPVNATFTVTLSAASTQTVSVQYATANNTATAPADYATTSGTVTFAPGDTSETFTVAVAGDTLDEDPETFLVNLTNSINATINDGQAIGTINDDDPTPSLSINDVTVTEGNSGSTNATFTVSLSAASGRQVTVQYATANGTATAGADYSGASGTVTFAPGETSKPVVVAIVGDTLDEPNETFTVTLTTAVNATIADGTGAGTITDDDATPSLAVNDVAADEGNTGTKTFTFTVTLSAPSGQTVTVGYATSNGTAQAPGDYVAANGTLTFAPGEFTKTFGVTVNGDTVGEAHPETFNVTLSSPTNATIADGSGVGSINNDDGAIPGFSVNDASLTEGDTGSANMTFTVTLSPASSQSTSVHHATSNGSATAGTDYTATSGDLTFAPGEVTKIISVPILGDAASEPAETFTVTLSAPTNGAALTDPTGTGTINDNDAAIIPSRPVRVGAAGGDSALWISNGYGSGFRTEGGVVQGAPAMVRVPGANNSAVLLEIVIGADNRLWWKREGGAGFAVLSNTARCFGSPAAVVTDDGAGGFILTAACMGGDRSLWYDQGPVTTTSTPVLDSWAGLGGLLNAGPAVAVVQNVLTFMVPGGDNRIYQRTLTSNGYTPTPWFCLGHPALATWGTTSYFACTGTDRAAWYAVNTGSGWSGAASIGGLARGGPGLAVTPDEAVIFVHGDDDAVWQASVSETRPDVGFSRIQSRVISEIGATVL